MVRLDNGQFNADWTKQSWDLDIHTIEDLLVYLQQKRMTPEHFMRLPIYRLNVEKLPWLKELAKHV